jgi:hypothetical protein
MEGSKRDIKMRLRKEASKRGIKKRLQIEALKREAFNRGIAIIEALNRGIE